MAMKVGDVIKVDDVPSAVLAKIESFISNYSNSSYSTGSVAAIKSAYNTVETRETTQDANNTNIVQGNILHVMPVLRLIYDGIRQACRLGTCTYRMYENTGYANVKNYTPPIRSYTVNVIFSGLHSDASTLEKYVQNVNYQNKTTLEQVETLYKGEIVKVMPLSDLIDKCKIFSASKKQSMDKGLINSCYYSCHSSCHGSSRSRR